MEAVKLEVETKAKYPELGTDIIKLVGSKLFFAHVLKQFRRIVRNDMEFVAGVSLGPGYVNFLYNEEKYWALPEKERLGILEHEVMHVVYLDVATVKEKYTNSTEAMLWNIAQDIRINNRIEGFHDEKSTCYNVENTSKMLKKELPKDATDDVYYSYLKQEYEKQKEEMEKFFKDNQLDGHGEWKESEGYECSSSEFAKEIIRNMVNKAVRSSGGIGNCAGDVALAIDKLNTPIVSWKNEIRKFVSRVKEDRIKASRKRRNRRYGLLFSGKVKEPQLTLAVCVDSSGSMSDDTLVQVYSEIKAMSQAGAEVTVIEADAEVQQVYKFDPRKMPTVKGRGGTAYNPAILKAKELNVDGIIYVGDFDCADTPENPGIPFMWVGFCENGRTPPGGFGKVIYIPEVKGERK